jgi:hypothetical protein
MARVVVVIGKVVGSLADLAVIVLGIGVLVYAAIETPGGVGYVALLALAGLVLMSVSAGGLVERWTTWRRNRHFLLGVASLFGGMGGLALIELLSADDLVEVIPYGFAAFVLIPFALVVLFSWLRSGTRS